MILLEIPGKKQLRIHHLVLDYNGTIAEDGTLLPEVGELLISLAQKVQIHVITADTFGTCSLQLSDLPVTVTILQAGNQDKQKMQYIKKLGNDNTISIGNGYNDHLMVEASAIGIVVINKEGVSVKALSAADLVCNNIHDALGLLINPMRLSASLRN
jgi:soluble P-type ATPase